MVRHISLFCTKDFTDTARKSSLIFFLCKMWIKVIYQFQFFMYVSIKGCHDCEKIMNNLCPLIYLLFSTFNESIMPCEIEVLIELYGPIDTGVIIWITSIIGKIDYLFLSSVFRSQVQSSSGLSHFFPRDTQIDVISMYFIFARTFDLVRSFFFFFFFLFW